MNPATGQYEPGKLNLTSDTVRKREHLFARFLNSEQAKGIKARNAAEAARYNDLLRKRADLLNAESAGAPISKEMRLTSEEEQFLKDYKPAKQVTIPELTPMEQAAFDNDPVMQHTLQWWLSSWQPYIENIGPQAGIKTDRVTPSGAYSKIKWHSDPEEVPTGSRIFEQSAIENLKSYEPALVG